MSLKLNIIIGSTRPGRVGPVIGDWLKEFAKSHGKFDVELVDLADFNLPLLDEASHPRLQQYEHEHTRRWSKSVGKADAYVFITPEYDYFPPASLVNAVQALALEWHYKAAGVVSYGGISGGLRSAQSLRQLLSNVNVHALPQTVPVPFFPQFISEEGEFRANEQMNEGAKAMLDELHKWATALKTIRSAQENRQDKAA
ncbi:NADPH-dependent FMN reductase [Chelativorans sp. J32]|uniref:NADPH-dependent FMN reductase n=1 Tax=Chelativorans sp. J32 TaxID=935840 RepID=UPI0004883F99|nr:NADPH-dependent FMN reductase [Chelativorans sp. J32]